MSNDTISIPLSKTGKNAGKYETVIDAIDADLAEFNWNALGQSNYSQYAARRVSSNVILLHRVILSRMIGRELSSNERVDHINSNGLDNRRENLRLANHSQNMQNRRKNKNNTSGYKGVTWYKRLNKWLAQISVNNTHIYLGLFDDPESAYVAYCEAAKRYFDRFARLED